LNDRNGSVSDRDSSISSHGKCPVSNKERILLCFIQQCHGFNFLKSPEESNGRARDGRCKEMTCTGNAQLKIAKKELMLNNMELDHKLREQTNPKGLLSTMMGDANENDKSECNPAKGDDEHADKFCDDDEFSDDEPTIPQECSWPNFMFGGKLKVELCQAGGKKYLHHVCQTEWEHKLHNQDLRKLCFPCANEFVEDSQV